MLQRVQSLVRVEVLLEEDEEELQLLEEDEEEEELLEELEDELLEESEDDAAELCFFVLGLPDV